MQYRHGERHNLSVHQDFGWIFRFLWSLVDRRWDSDYDVHHRNDDHTDNSLTNLECWRAGGPGGHRAESALGVLARGWRRQQRRSLSRFLGSYKGLVFLQRETPSPPLSQFTSPTFPLLSLSPKPRPPHSPSPLPSPPPSTSPAPSPTSSPSTAPCA